MTRSEARVRTPSADRYAKRLVKHAAHMVARVDWAPPRGVIWFPRGGTCRIEAGPDELVLVAKAATPEELSRIREIVGGDLERFARRDGLKEGGLVVVGPHVSAWTPSRADVHERARTPRVPTITRNREETSMADRPPYPSTDDAGMRPTADGPPGTPLWVKVFGIVGVVLILLVVVMLLFGGGNHGPGRHMGSHAGGHARTSVGAEHGALRS